MGFPATISDWEEVRVVLERLLHTFLASGSEALLPCLGADQPPEPDVLTWGMTKIWIAPAAGFTPGERDYIRGELDMFFSTLPTVAEGFQLKVWRGGQRMVVFGGDLGTGGGCDWARRSLWMI